MDAKINACFTARYAFAPDTPVKLMGEPEAVADGTTVEFAGMKDAVEALTSKLKREIADANVATCEKGGHCLPRGGTMSGDSMIYEAPLEVLYTTLDNPGRAMKAEGVARIQLTELPAMCENATEACGPVS